MTDLTNPGSDDFWLIPLGGTGEIGKNLNLYGHNGEWLMVDCGIGFCDQIDKNGFTQSSVIMPDIEFVRRIKNRLVGLLVTHAHEDHIGAIPYLWDDIGCAIYATGFARSILLEKLLRAGSSAPVIELDLEAEFQLGGFHLKPVPMTHSTPETFGFVIETSVGRVFHTADWKLDSDPIVGLPARETLYRDLGPLDAVISDSTNALEPDAAISEGAVFEGLMSLIKETKSRVVVTCFASNVARMKTLGRIAKATGRYLGLAGPSLKVMERAARSAGYLDDNFDTYDLKELSYLPPEEVLIIATGSQGQVGSALHRLATDQHPDLHLSSSDQVIFSSKSIPGNEKTIELLVSAFRGRGIQVWQAESSNQPLHGSGHGGRPELLDLFTWTAATTLIPVHGETKHLEASAEIGLSAGMANVLIGRNGCKYDLIDASVELDAVPTGILQLDNYGNLIPISEP